MEPSLTTKANECRNGKRIPEIVHTRIDGFNDKYAIPEDPLRNTRIRYVSDTMLTVTFLLLLFLVTEGGC